MPGGADSGAIRRGRITYLPVVPGRMEFAVEVRRFLLADRPKIVAVELPQPLESKWMAAIDRLPAMSVSLFAPHSNEDEVEPLYAPVEPADPFTEAVRTARELGAEIIFADPGVSDQPHLAEAYPDSFAVQRIGYARYVREYLRAAPPVSGEASRLASAIAWRVQGADPFEPVCVVVSLNLLPALLDEMDLPQQEPNPVRLEYQELLNPHPDCLIEVTSEAPFLQALYEEERESLTNSAFPAALDRPRAHLALLRDAETGYEANTGDRIVHWQRRLIARYSRNLAITESSIVAGVYDLTLAARSIVDDNYAWEVWQAANQYPWQIDTGEPETVRLSGDQVWRNTRRIRLRRRLPRPKQLLRPRGLKDRPAEKTRGEWSQSLSGDSICSYPPEDLVIENYGKLLKGHAKHLISEERLRIEPFTTSVLDGIDLRETIRHWYEKKLYVRQFDKMHGEVGAVVIIFDEDRADRYSYMTTWLGEHQNESDMAFYATNPFDHMVGPGIGRGEYGGLLMVLPPRRMFNVWSDPDYALAESKAEVLLLAALDYAVHKYVVYVAARPPRSLFRSLAARLNRQILYVPIGQLSSDKLKKIRVVHVLDGHDKREIAQDYIW